ncbi:hypothetical protein BpHYR1_052727 [Brachionus plicatilis]|uniref:Uncharacterized protein n=1 Tax=Brachionus plicatilis TaxID=10195 RepID=A0A3M7SKE8_BRAPC|nr:hypothetical protein BpHYR1_052727 [Brachionus plicatilis]
MSLTKVETDGLFDDVLDIDEPVEDVRVACGTVFGSKVVVFVFGLGRVVSLGGVHANFVINQIALGLIENHHCPEQVLFH